MLRMEGNGTACSADLVASWPFNDLIVMDAYLTCPRKLQLEGERGAQIRGPTNIDMPNLGRAPRGIHVEQHADAHSQAAGYGYLARTHQRHLGPAQRTGRDCWKFRVQIVGQAKNRAGNIFAAQLILADHQLQKFRCRGQNVLALIVLNGCRAANAPAIHHALYLLGKSFIPLALLPGEERMWLLLYGMNHPLRNSLSFLPGRKAFQSPRALLPVLTSPLARRPVRSTAPRRADLMGNWLIWAFWSLFMDVSEKKLNFA